MDAFPIFLDVRGRDCLVVGGGTQAAAKAALLLRCGAQLVVVAAAVSAPFRRWIAEGRCVHRAEPFRPQHLAGAALVIAADPDRAVNERVSQIARALSLPVNAVDRPALCTFTMPAIVDRSPVLIAISTGGTAPTLARLLRARLETLVPAAYGGLAQLAAAFRPLAKRRLADPAARRRFWQAAFEGGVAELAFAGRAEAARRALHRLLDRAAAGETATTGMVHMIAAGHGDPELLTLKAVRLLHAADVIVHDFRLSPELLDLARRDAVRIAVGQGRDHGDVPAAMAGTLMVGLARAGKRIVRLKARDLASACGDGEIAILAAAGIACEILPGIAEPVPSRGTTAHATAPTAFLSKDTAVLSQ